MNQISSATLPAETIELLQVLGSAYKASKRDEGVR